MAWFVPLIPYAIAAVGAVYSAKQQSKAGERSAAIDEANAKVTRQQTATAEEAQRRRNAMVMGTMRADAAESGFAPGGGSLLTLQTKTAGELELDVLTSRYRGELDAMGLSSDAETKRSNARSAMTTGYLNAAGYAASAGAKYYAGSQIDKPRAYPGNQTGFYGGSGRSGD